MAKKVTSFNILTFGYLHLVVHLEVSPQVRVFLPLVLALQGLSSSELDSRWFHIESWSKCPNVLFLSCSTP